MIPIESFHADIRSTIKKHNSAFASPEDIDFAINRACLDILDELIKEHENSSDRFKIDQEMLSIATFSGSSEERTLPSNTYKVSSVFIDDFEGDLLSDKQFNDRQQSVIMPPTNERPIATIYNKAGAPTIRILPANEGHRVKYWSVPATCKYNYTSTDGVISYSSSGSVDIDMPLSTRSLLFNRVLVYLTPSVKNAEAAQIERNVLR